MHFLNKKSISSSVKFIKIDPIIGDNAQEKKTGLLLVNSINRELMGKKSNYSPLVGRKIHLRFNTQCTLVNDMKKIWGEETKWWEIESKLKNVLTELKNLKYIYNFRFNKNNEIIISC